MTAGESEGGERGREGERGRGRERDGGRRGITVVFALRFEQVAEKIMVEYLADSYVSYAVLYRDLINCFKRILFTSTCIQVKWLPREWLEQG